MSPSLQTMGFFMSNINFCNTKEQLNHLGEVVTGKVDGSPTGADIDTSTLPYTGQVRRTLPSLEAEYEQSITNKEIEADAAIDSYRLLNKGPYAPGITLESKFEFITYNGESYFATNPPYTTTATTPDADTNLFIGGYVSPANLSSYTDITFNTVSDMKSGSPIQSKVGDSIGTKGYYSSGDQGGAKYLNRGQGWPQVADQLTNHSDSLGNYYQLQIENGEINVRQSGAVGNWETTDDYASFQSAYDATKDFRFIVPGSQTGGGTSGTYSMPVVSIPYGLYWVGQKVRIDQYARIKGTGNAIISGASKDSVTNGDHYLFGWDDDGLQYGGWQLEFGGICAIKTHGMLDLKSDNLNQGKVDIYDFEAKGLEEAIRTDCQSSIITIRNFKYDRCKVALNNRACDLITLKDGRIQETAQSDYEPVSIIHSRGRMKTDNVYGVPAPHTGLDAAWIKNGDGDTGETCSLVVNNFIAGGENGSHALINNHVIADTSSPVTPNGFEVFRSSVYSASRATTSGNSTLVRLFEIPNNMKVNWCSGLAGTDNVVEWYEGGDVPEAKRLDISNYWIPQRNGYVLEGNNFDVFEGDQVVGQYLSGLFSEYQYTEVNVRSGATMGINTRDRIPRSGVYDIFFTDQTGEESDPAYRQCIYGQVVVSTVNFGSGIEVAVEYIEQGRTGVGSTPSPSKIQLQVACVNASGADFRTSFPVGSLGDYYFRVNATGYGASNIGPSPQVVLQPRIVSSYS